MRIGGKADLVHLHGSRGTVGPRLVVLALTLALAAGGLAAGVPAATADGGGQHGYPSQSQVDAARAAAARKAHDVSAIRTRLLLAHQRVDAADTRAEQAAEAYNGAMWRLSLAKQAVAEARAAAAKARAHVTRERDAIGALVAQSYQQGGQLTSLEAILGADGPEGVMSSYAGFQGASTALQADYQRFAASSTLAKVFERKAEQARSRQQRLAERARAARAQAAAMAKQAQAAAARVAAQKQTLIRQLAKAQHVSVAMARQRQEALAQIARRRAEARARAAAAAAARKRAAEQAAAQRRAAQQQAARKRAAANRSSQSGQSGQPAAPNPAPPAPAPPPAPVVSAGGASQAIAFARAQLGEPYQWGGAGPNSWDCSGLTMMAWGSAGVSLPHFAEAQYYDGTPIPVSSAQPGDLLFWTSNGRPSGIHHVAIYVGGGQFIEAPHTGASVRYDSIYSWFPNYAVRL